MYAFFDRHGKKLLAVAAAFLIVIFLLPPNFGQRGPGGGPIGSLNGKPIDHQAAEYHYGMLRELERIYFGQGMRAELIVNLLFPPEAYRQITRDGGLTWHLLVLEARSAGVTAPDETVQMIAQQTFAEAKPGQQVPFAQLSDNAQNQVREAIRTALSVLESSSRSALTSKVSKPMIDEEMASRHQQVRARLVEFNAADFVSQVATPSDEELRAQFDGFASTLGGNPDPNSNPFGFGYRVPDKLRVQFVSVPNSEVERAVVASMTPAAWEEQARVYYLTHKSEFAKVPSANGPTTGPSTTQSTTRPTTGPTTAQSAAAPATTQATQPSTQAVAPPFEQIADKVYETVRKPMIEKQRQVILNKIRQQMSLDYQRATQATGTTTSAAVTSYNVPLSSYDYLLKIRDEIQKQFNVTITVGGDGALLTQKELRAMPGLGDATLEVNSAMQMGSSSAASYIFQSLKPLLPADEQNKPELIDVNQITPNLKGKDGVYIARVVEVAKSHAPNTLQEVRGQVERDVIRRQAFAKATEAARAAIDSLKLGDLSTYKERPVITTDWFGLMTPEGIPGVPETVQLYANQLVSPIFNLQRGLGSTAELPKRDVIKLQAVDKAVVAELFEIRNMLPPFVEGRARAEVEDDLRRQFITPDSIVQWFTPETVKARVGFVEPEGSGAGPDDSDRKQPMPVRPIPGM